MIDDERIRQILLKKWDPCGVGFNPNLADDYDEFVTPIRLLLQKKPSAKEIEDFLDRIEKEVIEWSISAEDRTNAALALHDLIEDSN